MIVIQSDQQQTGTIASFSIEGLVSRRRLFLDDND